MSTRNLPVKGDQRVKPTTSPQSVNRLCRKCGILDVSEVYRPPWPVYRDNFAFVSNEVHNRTPSLISYNNSHKISIKNLYVSSFSNRHSRRCFTLQKENCIYFARPLFREPHIIKFIPLSQKRIVYLHKSPNSSLCNTLTCSSSFLG
jgi:hypothetical protein